MKTLLLWISRTRFFRTWPPRNRDLPIFGKSASFAQDIADFRSECMSYTEIHHQQGMPFGGMPYNEILYKLEETDPVLVDDVRGNDQFYDLEDAANQYIRSEIIDWSPDPPHLESDHPKRDPAQARSILNLRYNGTRGSHYELPQHPELFIGFTGNDPRGVDTEPRFDVMRAHMEARAANLQTRMGVNVGHGETEMVAERPWTNQSISYGHKEIHRRLRDRHTKVFTPQKEGRPFGRNHVVDEMQFRVARAAQLEGGEEGLFVPEQDGGGVGAPAPHYVHGYSPAREAMGGPPRRVDRSGNTDSAPWRHATGDADLQVQSYGAVRSGTRPSAKKAQAAGGARLAAVRVDQNPGVSWAQAHGTNREVLGASMAVAARHRRTNRSARPDADPGQSHEGMTPGQTAPGLRSDVAHVYRAVTEDAERRPTGTIQDDEQGGLGSAAGLVPTEPTQSGGGVLRATQYARPTNSHLTDAEAIVTGLQEGTAAARRQIQNQIVAAGHMGSAAQGQDPGRGPVPADDSTRIAQMTKMPLATAAAAQGLEVQSYAGYVPQREQPRVAVGQAGAEESVFRRPGSQRQNQPLGRFNSPEWRSHTQTQGALVLDTSFGWDGQVGAGAGHGSAGAPTVLRAGGWSDGSGLGDDGFGQSLAAAA